MAKKANPERFDPIWPLSEQQQAFQSQPLHERHRRTEKLKRDGRIASPPRYQEVIAQDEHRVVTVRVYPGLDGAAGSELLSIALLDRKDGSEHECRFDELYPIWVTFKREDDATRGKKAKTQIERTGGIEGLAQGLQGTDRGHGSK